MFLVNADLRGDFIQKMRNGFEGVFLGVSVAALDDFVFLFAFLLFEIRMVGYVFGEVYFSKGLVL